MDLEVSNIHFLDNNNNQRLDKDEKAFIVFDICNTSRKTLYNITPNLTCNSKRVVISAPATIASFTPRSGYQIQSLSHCRTPNQATSRSILH